MDMSMMHRRSVYMYAWMDAYTIHIYVYQPMRHLLYLEAQVKTPTTALVGCRACLLRSLWRRRRSHCLTHAKVGSLKQDAVA